LFIESKRLFLEPREEELRKGERVEEKLEGVIDLGLEVVVT
jgi:hypothetical protein